MSSLSPIICLMGPTASGKTQLAVNLVQQFPFEIVSVDSAMVYRGMDIGTAKPGPDILHKAPHHLIDLCDPKDAYSAAQFRDDALRLLREITERGHIPLLVGGTMLYFRALLQGLAEMPEADPVLRKALALEGETLGWDVLHARLQTIDPEAAARIHAHDSQRIQRALEVYQLSGKNITTWQREQDNALDGFSIHQLAVAPSDRSILHDRIAARFKQMLADGLIDEVKRLYQRGDLSLETPAIRSVGYRQVWQYLEGQLSYDEMQERGIIATRQLAKRQLTWLRSWPGVVWFDSESPTLMSEVVPYLESIPVWADTQVRPNGGIVKG